MGYSVFVIGEIGSTHDNDLNKALRAIRAVAECGADAAKLQVCTNIDKLMEKRGEKKEARPAYEYLKTTKDWLPILKAECVKVGIKFGCTAFIEEDIPLVAPYVDFFKIAAKESSDLGFVQAHFKQHDGKEVIISRQYQLPSDASKWMGRVTNMAAAHQAHFDTMYCVSKYPCPIDDLKLIRGVEQRLGGLSDHTTSTLTGALAVAVGARVIEKHVRLWDTDRGNPDFPHSMICEPTSVKSFAEYVSNIRHAEKCL